MENDLEFLEKNGFSISPQGVNLSGVALELYNSFIINISNILKPYYNERLKASSLIQRETLEKTGYIDNFPQNLIGFDRKLGKLKDHFLTPASCFHVYPKLDNTTIDKAGFWVLSTCGRYEGGKWKYPFRLCSFNMLEVVIFGSEEYIEKVRKNVTNLFRNFFSKIGLEGNFFMATDAFYLNGNKGAKILQKIKELKKEYRVEVDGEEIALMSINKHEKYFSNRFNIKLSSKESADSMCIAFGLERLVAIGLIKWGNKDKWPRELIFK